ncbi:cytochrome P450 reductase [Tanacetum coccineum]
MSVDYTNRAQARASKLTLAQAPVSFKLEFWCSNVFRYVFHPTLLAPASLASDPKEASRIKFLASRDEKDEYAEWIFASKRILLDILEAFPSAKPPLGIFFAVVALCLQSRLYSIPSSPK